MEEYIQNYDDYRKMIVYDFKIEFGGIGDCISYFIYLLRICIRNKYRLYYKINNIPLENYIKLKHSKMYIKEEDITNPCKIEDIQTISHLTNDIYYTITPHILYDESLRNNVVFYQKLSYKNFNIEDVFEFSDEVKMNSHILLPENITNYISIHLRMGDAYLETDNFFVCVKYDTRKYNENNIFKCIEENRHKNIVFFCDNNNYKLKLKEKYNNIIITNCDIGHTSFLNTTHKQVLDTVTELYLIANSEMVYIASQSGFPIIASKFKNIPLINIF